MEHPTVIAGAGIAGLCAGLSLADRCPLLLADWKTPEAASAAVIAGLANPVIPRRGNLVWRSEAALDALDEVARQLGVAPLQPGVLRIATSWDQMDAYRARAASHGHLFTWHPPAASKAQWPWLLAPHGTLELHRGGSFDLPTLLQAGLRNLESRGASVRRDWRLTGWTESADSVIAEFVGPDGPRTFPCSRLILSLGGGFQHFEDLTQLKLSCVKGQLISVIAPDRPPDLRPVSVGGYVVPLDNRVVIGSSYQHSFDDPLPENALTEELLEKVSRHLPWLRGAQVDAAHAGVRVTVPGTRLPMVGPLPGHTRTWVLTGMASRGLLMGPLIGSLLPGWLEDPGTISSEVAVRIR
ncbi:MAG: FAD-binding oxidoreductase [Rhodothermales bacterium]|nr:FAD-binding oxidoreductase [Rhodothermales bacterium]